jgi:hypothetical protein
MFHQKWYVMTTLILYNGVIYTMNPDQPRAQAIAIRDGRVLAVGSEGKVQALAGGRAEGINLRGRTVIPALTDAHVHLVWYALGRRDVRLDDGVDYETAVIRVAEAAAQLPEGEWVRGGGWDHTRWNGRWPTAADLDALIPDKPVFLIRKDGHSAWVNSRALALAGIDETTPDPPGGSIRRERKQPTGLLFENAVDLVRPHIPMPSEETRLSAIRDAIAEAHSYGMVGMHIPPALQPGDAALALSDVQKLRERGQLKLRCLLHLGLDRLDEALALGIRSGLGDRWIRLGGLKMFADGSLGSETAEMLDPYEGRKHTGMPTLTDEELNTAVRKANAGGIAVTIHAIGDSANRRVLDAIEAASQGSGVRSQGSGSTYPLIPNRIEHAQVLHQRDIPRFAQLGVVVSMQPVHATSDMEMAQRLWGSRCSTAYAWRTLQEASAVLAFGSDAPVEALNPWLGIHAAVTRQRPDGTPPQGWYPEQRLSVGSAIWGFTTGTAIAAGCAHEQGTLMPGMLADMVVLPYDPFQIRPAELPTVTADITILEGEVVWEKER